MARKHRDPRREIEHLFWKKGQEVASHAVRSLAGWAVENLGSSDEDPYAVMGVSPTMPLDEIEALYKLKVKKLHPDTGAKDDGEFEKIAWAMREIRKDRRG